MTKEEQIKKSFDSSSSNSSLVHLNTQEADQFIDNMVDESVILKNSRVVKMEKPQKKIAKLGIANDIFHPATSGTALDESKRIEAGANQIELVSKEIIGEVLILDDELEDNIEGANFKDHLMRMIAKKGANQLESVGLYARKTGEKNTLYDLFDGYIKLITTYGCVVDAAIGFADRHVAKDKLAKLYKSLPTKYRQYIDTMYTPNDLIIDYETLYEATMNAVDRKGAFGVPFTKAPLLRTERPVVKTGGGSTTIASGGATAAQKTVTVVAVTNFEVGDIVTLDLGGDTEFSSAIASIDTTNKVLTLIDNLPYDYDAGVTVKETTLNGSDIIITPKNNLIWGIQRDITIEPERLARLRGTLFVITMRTDFQIEEPQSAGILTNLLVRD